MRAELPRALTAPEYNAPPLTDIMQIRDANRGVRQSGPMATRRNTRPTHVRPRPPSSGRPAPVKVRPRQPAPGRLAVHAPIRRSRGIPLVGQLALAAGVLVIGAGVLYLGVGGLGTVARSLGSTLTGFVEGVTATPSATVAPLEVSDAPMIESPTEPYTNQDNVDLVVTVPSALVGDEDHRLRVYLALEDQAAAAISEVPIGSTPRTIVPVELTKGINDFMLTIVGPGGESEPSPIVRYVLDTSKPGIKLASPKDGAVVNRKAVELKGRSQARATLIARNEANSSSITDTAGTDGLFSLRLPLARGSNLIHIQATDPAGNVKEIELTVRRGAGKLVASLSASDYRIDRSNLPEGLRLVASVTDPDGSALKGAHVTFTLSIPGIPTVTGEGTTNSSGRVAFETTIPKGADVGQGSAAILVETEEFGSTSDQTVVTITR
jgi:hypothetical protein